MYPDVHSKVWSFRSKSRACRGVKLHCVLFLTSQKSFSTCKNSGVYKVMSTLDQPLIWTSPFSLLGVRKGPTDVA
ncbi:hypothetical protein KC363_g5 [Hortaea werneckii]|nr:hypothetical protein KC363_g5 [Hortaea werneckii]